ncbi:MAG: M28 family peptidase [Bacteroidetes bacterium]|nr:M28 family peptidase [Bacteroidota bacterium]
MKYICVFCFLSLGMSLFAQDSVAIKYSTFVRSSDIKEFITVLASDSLEGRETAQPGQKKAARYIAKQFNSFGIAPYNNTYFQPFYLSTIKPEQVSININGKELDFLVDYYHLSNFSNAEISADKAIFITKPTSNLKDKVVFTMLKGYTEKEIKELMNSGASAVFLIDEKAATKMNLSGYRLRAEKLKVLETDAKHSTPLFFLSIKSAKKALRFKIKMKNFSNKELECTVGIKISIESDKVSSENVLGYVEGSDLKNEVVVITAHYDHLGIHDGKIYYGADDDGSGTAAVIALSKAFQQAKKEGHGPRRSILFMTVSGEEKGLLGSSFYTSNPIFPLASTVADLNIDMIGRIDEKHGTNPDYVYLIGSDKLSSQLHKISDSANTMYTKLELDYTFNAPEDPNRFYYRSDHYNFAKNGIPVIFYFNGTHADYHQPSDTVDKINFDKVEKIARLVFFTAWELANRNEKIIVDTESDFKNTR